VTLRIPQQLLPRDGRFGCGPSKLRPEAVAALSERAATFLGTSHRQAPVRQVVSQIRRGIADLLRLPDGYEVVLGNGGASAFFDAASFSLIEERSQHLCFGEFSRRFAEIVGQAPHLAEPQVISSEPSTHPEAEARRDVDAYALTQNETSTGVAMEVRRPRFTSGEEAEGLVLVDATSAAGGLEVDPAQFDAYYFAPQKCLASDGGLFLAALSPKATERVRASRRWAPPTLDLRLALENSMREQTYNTPALATLLLVAEEVEWLNESGGLSFAAARCKESAAALYGWAEASEYATPFVCRPADRSAVVGTIDFAAGVVAAEVASCLRSNGVVDTEPYRKLGRNQLRIGMFPAVEPDDVRALTACIDWIVPRLAD
jgi:phosphoserine aminotransferase